MLPNIKFQLGKGALGQVAATQDGVVGLVVQVPPGTFNLGIIIVVTGIEDAKSKGFTPENDILFGVNTFATILQFYLNGVEGTELYIYGVSNLLGMSDICNPANTYLQDLVNIAGGKISIVSIIRNLPTGYGMVPQDGLDKDVYDALGYSEAFAEAQKALFAPVVVILPAIGFEYNPLLLRNLKQNTQSSVSIFIGDDNKVGASLIACFLGRLSKIPVQRNAGRVKDGALLIPSLVGVKDDFPGNPSLVEAIHNKGFVTLRKHVRKSGYYVSDDPTATSDANDYIGVARNRVINKVLRIAYDRYVEELLDEIALNASGQISAAQATYYETLIERAISQLMVATGELASITAFVDPTQNVLATNKLCIDIRVVPVGYAKEILIKLGFDNPQNL